jgi:hypothetical protein
MDFDLDINWENAGRAANGMISTHGKDALAEGERRAQNLRYAGCYSAAMGWDIICDHIQGRIGGDALVGSTVAPKLAQSEMPGRATLKASFFETL